jgi:hypothetical protein
LECKCQRGFALDLLFERDRDWLYRELGVIAETPKESFTHIVKRGDLVMGTRPTEAY